jgi:four helix bundle protein
MLVAYDVSLDLIRSLRPTVEALASRNKDLADQLQCAASSICLNLGEGSRRSKGDQRRFYGYASGSAMEVRAALDTADAWGWVCDADKARRLLDRLLGLLWGLTHERRSVRQSP